MTQNRDDLIAAKEAVKAELARTQCALERAQAELAAASGLRRSVLSGRVRQLESRAERLMAQEHDLRLAIDRNR